MFNFWCHRGVMRKGTGLSRTDIASSPQRTLKKGTQGDRCNYYVDGVFLSRSLYLYSGQVAMSTCAFS